MRFSRAHPRSRFCCGFLLAAFGLAGCGNSCFVGFSVNGNGGFIVKTGNPPPVCSLNQANGAVRAVALQTPVCEACTPAARVQHVFVTLRGIQLHADAKAEPDSPGWLDLAPQLATELRQIDLMDGSTPQLLVQSTTVPAGGYRQVRLQFLRGSPQDAGKLPAGNACGPIGWNCLVMGNGHVEPLHLPGDGPDLLISSQSVDGGLLMVLPDTLMELRLGLAPQPVGFSVGMEGWTTQNVLVGRVAAAP